MGVQHGRPIEARALLQLLDGTGGERQISSGRPNTAMMHHKPQANRYRGGAAILVSNY